MGILASEGTYRCRPINQYASPHKMRFWCLQEKVNCVCECVCVLGGGGGGEHCLPGLSLFLVLVVEGSLLRL